MRDTKHGGGLVRWRWVEERSFASLNEFRRLRVRCEKRPETPRISDPRVHSDPLEVPTNSTLGGGLDRAVF